MGKSPSHKKSHTTIPKWAQQQDRLARSKKYPNCKGTFPDCPVEIKPDAPASECLTCPFYK